MDRSTPSASRRGLLYLLYVAIWIAGSIGIGIPVLNGLSAILNLMDPTVRILFYVMPAFLSGLLVLGVLQIISMYRYWFGPH
jgi:hypothetical protein